MKSSDGTARSTRFRTLRSVTQGTSEPAVGTFS